MVCSTCSNDYAEDCFPRKANGERRKQCKFCKRVACRRYYVNNKSDYVARALKKNKETRRKLRHMLDTLKSVPCADCGKTFPPCAMDFDHRDRTSKSDNVATLAVRNGSIRAIMDEIAKCDIVCACCHRIRTFTQNRKLFGDRDDIEFKSTNSDMQGV